MPTITCVQALETLSLSRRNVARWRNLVYAFGVALMIFTMMLLVLIWKGTDPTKILAGIGAVVSGVGTAFVVKQLKAAEEVYAEDQRKIKPACGSQRDVPTGRGLDPAPVQSGAESGFSDDIITALTK